MNIEQIAVNAVSECFDWSDRFHLEATSNDKTQFTDGHLDLYSERAVKAEILGRIQIQIKGVSWTKRFPDEATYSVSLEDARGFLRFHGALFFVVLVHRKTRKRRVYARALNPLKLTSFVNIAGTKKKQVLRFAPIPEGEEDLVRLASFALEAQKETNPVELDPKLLTDGASLTLYSPRPLDLSRPLELDHAKPGTVDFSLFLRTEGGIRAPLNGGLSIIPADYIDHEIPIRFESGDVVFENPIGRKIDDRTLRVSPTSSLTMEFASEKNVLSGKVNVKDGGPFDQYLDAINFFLAACDSGAFRVGERAVPFAINSVDDLESLRVRRAQLVDFRALFAELNIPEHLISTALLDDASRRELDTIHRALVSGERIPAKKPESGRIAAKVCGWRLELMCRYQEEGDSWAVENPFSPSWPYVLATSVQEADGIERIDVVTPYDLIGAEQIHEVLNLSLGDLVGRYEALPDNPSRYTYANLTTLKLITGADQSECRRDEFLTAARDLNSWLLGHDPESEVHRLNGWQISARLGGLDESERKEAYVMMMDGTNSELGDSVVRYVCAVLLGEEHGIELWGGRLTSEQREFLKPWPIMNLIP